MRSVKVINQTIAADWAMYHGDSAELLRGMDAAMYHDPPIGICDPIRRSRLSAGAEKFIRKLSPPVSRQRIDEIAAGAP